MSQVLEATPDRPSYRAALREPGVARVCASGVIGRVPESMTGICLVLISHARGGYGAGGLQVGLLGLLEAASAPVWGRLADRQGLRRILLITGIAQALALMALGPAARSGTTAGLIAAAVTGLVRPPIAGAVRARWAALALGPRAVMQAVESALTETVYMLGPVVLGVVLLFGTPGDGLLVSAVLVFGGCLSMASAPGIAGGVAAVNEHAHRDLWGPLRLAALRLVSGVFFFQVIAMAGIEVTLTALCNNQGRPALSGPLIGVWALGSAIGGLLWGSRHHPGSARLRFGLLGLATGLLLGLFAVSDRPAILFAIAVPAGLAIAPGAQTGAGILARVIPGEQLVEAYGWSSAAAPALGSALGYALGGALIQHHGPQLTALVFAGIALLAPALITLRRSDLPAD